MKAIKPRQAVQERTDAHTPLEAGGPAWPVGSAGRRGQRRVWHLPQPHQRGLLGEANKIRKVDVKRLLVESTR